MEVNVKWQKAFAKQAASDKDCYDYLFKNKDISGCQKLHYLQMCLEKIAKAYLYRENQIDNIPNNIQTSHNFILKILPQLYKEYCRTVGFTKLSGSEYKKIRLFCKELDFLAPANNDNKKRLDNCEYPWAIYECAKQS